MKNLLYLAAIVCLAATAGACSEKEEEWNGMKSNVKLVRSIVHVNGNWRSNPYVLEYDELNRITKFEDYTLSYNGNTMTMKSRNGGTTYTCTLNSAGYATKVVYEEAESDYSIVDEHTYDKNGYLTHCKEHWDEEGYSDVDNWSFKWENGNLISFSGPWSGKFTYGTTANVPINLDLFYITDDYGCELGEQLGFLGFLGRQNKNLPTTYVDEDGYTINYKYEFNADGTVSKVTFGAICIELYY